MRLVDDKRVTCLESKVVSFRPILVSTFVQFMCFIGLILSSPSNPTGAMLSCEQLDDLCKLCLENQILFISDEIYHGITYGKKESTALEFNRDNAVVINSFSKYFSMTGWRLGWM